MIDFIKHTINYICDPKLFISLMFVWCVVSVAKPEWWVKPKIFAGIMSFFVALYIFAIFDHNFQQIAFKGDNIPIIMMLFLVVYFTWLAFYRGHQNDLRRAAGQKLIEEEGAEVKVL